MYSPKRPVVDISEIFLWLMAVGTVLGASFWSAWTAKEAAQEHYRNIKVCEHGPYVTSLFGFWTLIFVDRY